jgi:PAS domain S-box-containing protein
MFGKPINVLMVEDNPIEVLLVQKVLKTTDSPKFAVVHADCLAKGMELLAAGGVDLVLLDLGLPDSWGLDTLIEVLHQAPDLPVVVLTSRDDDDSIMQAVMQGAQDYLIKGQYDNKLLIRSLRYAFERNRVEQTLKEECDLGYAILEAISSLVLVLDPQGHIIRFNQACQEITGFTSDDIWDTYFWDLFLLPEEAEPIKLLFANLPADRQTRQYENLWLTKEGGRQLINWKLTVHTDRHHEIKNIILTGNKINGA